MNSPEILTGLVKRWDTSLDLNRVEYDTIMFPTLTARKKIKSIIEKNSCKRKIPIFILTRRKSITFLVNKNAPKANRK
jgi:hypothetical protein